MESCQERVPIVDFVNSPRRLVLNSSEFETPANPHTAFNEDGLRTETLTVPELEEYQNYVFSVRVMNSEGVGPEGENTVCERTQEAGECSPCVTIYFSNVQYVYGLCFSYLFLLDCMSSANIWYMYSMIRVYF